MKNVKIEDEIYCKVFVDWCYGRDELFEIVVDFLQAQKKTFYSLYNEHLFIFIEKNSEYDEQLKNDREDGFLYYRYIFEIYSQSGIDFKNYIKALKNLIDFLRKMGCKVIPACNFEERFTLGKNFDDYLNDGKNYKEFM